MTTTPTDTSNIERLFYAVTYAEPADEWLPRVIAADRVLKWCDHEGIWVGFILDPPNSPHTNETPLVVLRVEADWVVGYTVHEDLLEAMGAAHPPTV